jgi:hypothetical protein
MEPFSWYYRRKAHGVCIFLLNLTISEMREGRMKVPVDGSALEPSANITPTFPAEMINQRLI